MCSCKEAIVVFRQPITKFGLHTKCSELYGGLEIVPSRIINGQCERPVLCQIYFCCNIGNAHSQADGIGLDVQFACPFLHLGNYGGYNCSSVGHDFHDFNNWFKLNGIGYNHRLLNGWKFLLVCYEYGTGISHTLEEELVHLLPYLAVIQPLQFYDTVVNMGIRMMIIHQQGFLLQDGDYFILVYQS